MADLVRAVVWVLLALLVPGLASAEGDVPKQSAVQWSCAAGGAYDTAPRYGTSPEAACGAAFSQTKVVQGGSQWLTFNGCNANWDHVSNNPVTTCFYVEHYSWTTGTSGGGLQASGVRTNQCPDYSSVNPTGSCTCVAGYSPSGDGQRCETACAANAVASSGYYDIGTASGATPLLSGCKGSCKVYFDGTSPSGSALVDGVKHWYAKGGYYNSGVRCTTAQESATQVKAATQDKPADSCAAGQGSATMNGKTVCVDQSGDGKTPTPASTDQSSTTTDKSTVTNPDGSTTTTETTTKTDANGNREVTVTKTTNKPDGTSTSQTTTTNPGSTDKPAGEDDSTKSECEKNPSGAGCGGAAASIGDLYTPKTKTLGDVLGGARTAFMASPVGTAVGGFFVVSGGGGCPTWSGHIPYIDADIAIDQFCTAWAVTALAVLKAAVLVFCSFFAFRVAVE